MMAGKVLLKGKKKKKKKKKTLPMGVKAEKKKKKKTRLSLKSLSSHSQISQTTSLSLSLSLLRHGTPTSFSLFLVTLRRHSLSFITLLGAALSVSLPFFDRRHLPPLIIIVSISLLSFTYSHFLFQSIAPHYWLCDCRFLLLTVDSCSWISLLLLIFMRLLWVVC
jgi:hypothetical protein